MVFAGSIDSDWKIEDKLTNIIRVLQGLITTLQLQEIKVIYKVLSIQLEAMWLFSHLREVWATEEIDYNLGFKQIWNKT